VGGGGRKRFSLKLASVPVYTNTEVIMIRFALNVIWLCLFKYEKCEEKNSLQMIH
jgi:hypothetical protein